MGATPRPKRMTLSRCGAAHRRSTSQEDECYVLLNSERDRSGVKVKRRGVLRSRSEERRRGHRPRTNQPVGDVRSGSVASHGVQRPLQSGPEQEDREGGGGTEQKQDAGQRAAGRAGHRHAGVGQVQVSRPPALKQFYIIRDFRIEFLKAGGTVCMYSYFLLIKCVL